MKSRKKNSMLISAVVALAVVLLMVGCASCRSKKAEAESINQTDSVEQPQHLHPPVVIPHSWREELNSAKNE